MENVEVSYEELIEGIRDRLGIEIQNGLMLKITIDKLNTSIQEKNKEIEKLQKIISKYETKPKGIEEKKEK